MLVQPSSSERAPRHDGQAVAARQVERGRHQVPTGALPPERRGDLGVHQVEVVAVAPIDELGLRTLIGSQDKPLPRLHRR